MLQRTPSVVRRVVPLLSAAALSGCMVGPDYHEPDMHLSDRFASTQASTTQPTAVDLAQWWRTFNDPELDRLVDRAVMSNLDVRLAQARVREARANLEFTRGGLFPTLDGNASYTRARGSHNASIGVPSSGAASGGTSSTGTGSTGTSTGATGSSGSTGSGSGSSVFSLGETDLFQAGFDAGWEIDVFGGTRRAIESAQASLEAQIETRRNTLVTLLAEVAQNYVALRGYQHTMLIVQRNVVSQQDAVDLQRTKLQAGLATDLTVAQAEALLSRTQSQIPTLQTQIQQSIHRLSILLDQEPASLEQELTNTPPTIPTGPSAVPPGLPSELLRRRPDVRAAERQIEAATASIGVATADLFPKFSLNGAVGLSSAKFTNLPNSGSVFYSIGPSVSWRLFDAGQILANIRVQDAVQEQALLTYRQTVLQAFSEVEDTLIAYDREQARRIALQRTVDASRRALDLARQLNDAGVVDFLNVLTAQQSLYQAENDLAVSDQTVSTNLVALYKALGGGWETTDVQPLIESAHGKH